MTPLTVGAGILARFARNKDDQVELIVPCAELAHCATCECRSARHLVVLTKGDLRRLRKWLAET